MTEKESGKTSEIILKEQFVETVTALGNMITDVAIAWRAQEDINELNFQLVHNWSIDLSGWSWGGIRGRILITEELDDMVRTYEFQQGPKGRLVFVTISENDKLKVSPGGPRIRKGIAQEHEGRLSDLFEGIIVLRQLNEDTFNSLGENRRKNVNFALASYISGRVFEPQPYIFRETGIVVESRGNFQEFRIVRIAFPDTYSGIANYIEIRTNPQGRVLDLSVFSIRNSVIQNDEYIVYNALHRFAQEYTQELALNS